MTFQMTLNGGAPGGFARLKNGGAVLLSYSLNASPHKEFMAFNWRGSVNSGIAISLECATSAADPSHNFTMSYVSIFINRVA